MSPVEPNGTTHFGGGRSGRSPIGPSPSEPKPKDAAPQEPAISVIGAGISITGSVEADVDLQIDGRVMGDVRCGTLLLSENGVVAGNIVADVPLCNRSFNCSYSGVDL